MGRQCPPVAFFFHTRHNVRKNGMRVPGYGKVSSLRDDSLPSLPLFNGVKFDIFTSILYILVKRAQIVIIHKPKSHFA